MIKIYQTGEDFYLQNKEFLLTNIYTEVFFRLDAKLLLETNKEEYAICVINANKRLVSLRKKPYSTLFFGDSELVDEIIDYLNTNNYSIGDILSPLPLGEIIASTLNKRGCSYIKHLAMDYMICKESLFTSSDLVEKPLLDDVDELLELTKVFAAEVHLVSTETKDKIVKALEEFRVIKDKGKIVAMATVSESTNQDKRIAYVYTKPEYRGRHYAKMIVTNIVNETLANGLFVTLNVDQNNPISYHLYASLGFQKLFSQAVYLEKKMK